MDNCEIIKAIERLTNLSNEDWNLEWGEHEASFLIDLISSQMSELNAELDAEKSDISDLKSNIEGLEKELKEARKREKDITKKLSKKESPYCNCKV